MSEFDDYYTATTRPALKERNGEPIVYTDADGNQTPATAIVGEERLDEDQTDEGRKHRRSRELTLFKDEVSTVSMKGSVTVDGQRWSIERIIAETPAETLVELVRPESAEHSRPGYRRSL